MDSQSPLFKRLWVSALLIAGGVYLVLFSPFLIFFLAVELVILLNLNEFVYVP